MARIARPFRTLPSRRSKAVSPFKCVNVRVPPPGLWFTEETEARPWRSGQELSRACGSGGKSPECSNISAPVPRGEARPLPLTAARPHRLHATRCWLSRGGGVSEQDYKGGFEPSAVRLTFARPYAYGCG